MGSTLSGARNISWLSASRPRKSGSRTLSAQQEQQLGRDLRAAREAFWTCALMDSEVVEALMGEPELTVGVLDTARSTELEEILLKASTVGDPSARLAASETEDAASETEPLSQRASAIDQDHKILRRAAQRFPEKVCLKQAMRELDSARNRFIEANLGLVHSVAYKLNGHGLDVTDLVQEGIFGLMKAVDRFDPDRGFRFSTYAAWWIRYTTRKALQEQSCDVRRPSRLIQSYAKLQRVRARLSAKGELSEEAVLDETGLTEESLRQVEEFGAARWDSFEQPLHGADEKSLHDVIPANITPSDDVLDGTRRDRELREHLQHLGPRQLDIIERRFGLKGGHPMSLQQIADQYSVSRERIRQLQNKALNQIRTTYVRLGVREMDCA